MEICASIHHYHTMQETSQERSTRECLHSANGFHFSSGIFQNCTDRQLDQNKMHEVGKGAVQLIQKRSLNATLSQFFLLSALLR